MRLPRLHSEVSRHAVATALMVIGCGLVAVILALLGVDLFVRNSSGTLVLAFAAFGLYGPIFLLLTHWTFASLRGDALKSRLRRTHNMSPWLKALFLGGPKSWAAGIALVGLGTVTTLLLDPNVRQQPPLLIGCVIAIVGTWILLVAVYAVEYARLWANGHSIEFPDSDERRNLTDFVYLAVQVSTTFSSSDVSIHTTSARVTVTAHSIVAFAYNTIIIAVLVSFLMAIAS